MSPCKIPWLVIVLFVTSPTSVSIFKLSATQTWLHLKLSKLQKKHWLFWNYLCSQITARDSVGSLMNLHDPELLFPCPIAQDIFHPQIMIPNQTTCKSCFTNFRNKNSPKNLESSIHSNLFVTRLIITKTPKHEKFSIPDCFSGIKSLGIHGTGIFTY